MVPAAHHDGVRVLSFVVIIAQVETRNIEYLTIFTESKDIFSKPLVFHDRQPCHQDSFKKVALALHDFSGNCNFL